VNIYIIEKCQEIVKKERPGNRGGRFRKLRGVATVRMTTDEIMALTRAD
jgi:hypothetical protein